MASWIAWLTANMLFTIIAFQEQAWLAVAINGMGVVTNVLVVALSSFKKVPMKPTDRIDWVCLIVSLFCVAIIVCVPNAGALVAMLAMVANLTATVPTFRHAWSKPHEETWQLFAANAFANGLGVASIVIASGAEFIAVAGPLVSTLGNATLVTITMARKWIVAVEREVVEDIRLVEQQLAPVEQEVER